MPASARKRRPRLGYHRRALVVFAVVVVIAYGSGAPPVQAQDNGETPWQGSVEVSPSTLTLAPGQSLSYRVRLTEPPTADGWWVMVHVDGAGRPDGSYRGISWVPSVGWLFNQDNWDQWRGIVIRTDDDVELGTQVLFTHEVWDHNADCPVHNVGPVTLRVIDNGQPITPLPALTIDEVTVPEDRGNAVFTVGLSRQSTSTVTVGYATADGTADAGSDYTPRSGTLVFQPGQMRKTIAVPVLDDSYDEGNETFKMRLSNPRNAKLDASEGIATITDDDAADPPPELSIGDVTVAENGGNAVFTVGLSRQSTATVTVRYSTFDGTADADSDYLTRSGTLVFQPSETGKTIAVQVLDDSDQEGNETFTLRLSSPQNATLRVSQGTATITDDEARPPPPPLPPPPPELSIGDVTVAENGGNAVFTVGLSRQSTATVTVRYSTFDGTADADSDYLTRSGTLVFQPGETGKTIAVQVLDDSDQEGERDLHPAPEQSTERDAARLSGHCHHHGRRSQATSSAATSSAAGAEHRRRDGGRKRGQRGVHRRPEPAEHRDGDGAVQHLRRHRRCRFGLPHPQRDAGVSARRDGQDHSRARAR